MMRLLFSEPNPAPLKAALSMQGLLRDELRLPMVPATEACRQQLAAALEALDTVPLYRPQRPAASATSTAARTARYSLAHATAAV